MRFMEIANPEDQLALWKLISDKMWAAFAQPVPQHDSTQGPQSSTLKGRVASPAKPVARPISKTSHKASAKLKYKAGKPKRAPMAAAPKPCFDIRMQHCLEFLGRCFKGFSSNGCKFF